MIPFDFRLATRFVFGPGRLAELGSLVAELGVRRAMLVSDPGVIAAGHTDRASESLRAANVDVELFGTVQQNPTTRDVAAGVEFARALEPDVIIGLGGGSSLDCAKGTNLIYTNGGEVPDYWGVGKARRPMLPLVAVPTTAGTGSESQSFALISDPDTHVKMACGDPKLACRLALLDPELTLTQPPKVAAATGLDAISHAVESHVTRRRNNVSQVFSREAWRLLEANLPRVLSEPNDIEARGAMQLGACFGGLAIENSMLGAAHSLANPLTARYGIVHGEAVSMMLPHVIRFNAATHRELYEELCRITFRPGESNGNCVDALADRIAALVVEAGLPGRLSSYGLDESALPTLAAEAAAQWTAQFNPRDVDEAGMLELYRAAW
ncbi:MAG: iron-containing alcohol dehydrogenase [Planctomycetales bacterium]|nr:iron-containing alcohol dehydrogenase [Planctomycetales bacterium]